MRRLPCALLLFLGGGLGHAQTLADDDHWQVRISERHAYRASITADFQGSKGTVIGILAVEAYPQARCRKMMELTLLHGGGYGKPEGKVAPAETTPLYMEVDGRVIPVGDTFWFKYDNGYSAAAVARDDLVDAIKNGRTVHVMLTPGTPKFEFAIAGADHALGAIDARCQAATTGDGAG